MPQIYCLYYYRRYLQYILFLSVPNPTPRVVIFIEGHDSRSVGRSSARQLLATCSYPLPNVRIWSVFLIGLRPLALLSLLFLSHSYVESSSKFALPLS